MLRRLVVVIATVLVGACGPGASTTPSPSPTTISIVEYQPKRAQVIESLIPRFESETAARGHPIRIRLEKLDMTDDDFETLIAERYGAGTAPDIASYPTAAVAPLAEQGYVLDLASRVAAWPDWSAHFYPVLRQRAQSPGGHVYGIPRGATVIELFYRRDVLRANGVSAEQPRSWGDLLDRMRALRDRMHRPPILIPAGTQWDGGTFDEGFVNLWLGTGAEPYDVATGRWIVRSPGLTDVFRLYAVLVRDGLLPVSALLHPNPWEPTKYQTFPDGDLAVTTQGTWGWTFDWGPSGRRPIDDLEHRVGTWAFPREDGGDPFVWAAEAWRWTISATSRHPDEAWTFLRWISQGAPLAADLVAVGNLSPRDDIADIEPYRDQAELVAGEKLIEAGRSLLPYDGIDHVRAAAAQATQGILDGTLTADAAAAEFARLATRSLGADHVMDAPSTSP